MCFSAEASFTGAAVITAIGTAALVKVKKPKQILFAAIPIIFGIQQCAEGIMWITLRSGGHGQLQDAATYIFLVTALVIWPTMIPLSAHMLETEKVRKNILNGFTAAGGLVSLFYAYCLIFYRVTPQIESFHIQYVDNFPGVAVKIVLGLYLLVTIVPLFVSSVKRMWLFGILILISCLVTVIFYSQFLTSVWCFFAACISVVIFWVLNGINKRTDTGETESLP